MTNILVRRRTCMAAVKLSRYFFCSGLALWLFSGPTFADHLPPPGLFSAGGSFSMAVNLDGSVSAWGSNLSGQLGDGTTEDRWVSGRVKGPDGEGYLTGVRAVSAGSMGTGYALALKHDGTIWAWGENRDGQLGVSGRTSRLTPTRTRAGLYLSGDFEDAVAIAAGWTHSMALKSDGTVWAWGLNAHGQLGNGTRIDYSIPVQVVGLDGNGLLADVQAISVGLRHSLALTSNGTVKAWGRNSWGQLGNGTYLHTQSYCMTPLTVRGAGGEGFLSNVVAISAGHYHNLALLSDGTVWAWGSGESGQLGDGQSGYHMQLVPAPVKAPGGEGVLQGIVAIDAGDYHSLALTADGKIWGWGSGLPEIWQYSTLPIPVLAPDGEGVLTNVMAMSAGSMHSFAMLADGSLWAWGVNSQGRLGDGTEEHRNKPVAVIGLPGADDLLDHPLRYEAGAGGSIEGEEYQLIPHGGSGTVVTAVADTGAVFSGWSDGLLAHERQEIEVANALHVVAVFRTLNGVAIDWYDEHRLTPDVSETWSDLDDRYNPDKQMSLRQEYIADTDPHDPDSVLAIIDVIDGNYLTIMFRASPRRNYTLWSASVVDDDSWQPVPGAVSHYAGNGIGWVNDTKRLPSSLYYRLGVDIP